MEDKAVKVEPKVEKIEEVKNAKVISLGDKNEKAKKKEVKKTYIPPKVGLRSRAKFPIHIVFKEFDILLGPNQVTSKIYNESDIVSVHKMKLQEAIIKGLVIIVR